MLRQRWIRELFAHRKVGDAKPAREIFARLPQSAQSLAILAGAGVSLDSPANLLAGWDFMDSVLSRILPVEIGEDFRRSLIQVPRGRSFRPGEYIRFETLMMALAQSGIDQDLHVLDCLDHCEQPNANHYILAELIRRGAVVMTTNFDRLIEIAYQRTMAPSAPPLRVVYEDAEFQLDGAVMVPTLWKLHGSLSVSGQSTRASVQATIVQVLSPTMSRNKRKFVEAVIADRDLAIIGYSGSDDLDLVPILSDAPSERAMLWVNHVSSSVCTAFETASHFMANHRAITQYDVVGRDRFFFARGEVAIPAHADNVALVSANSAEIMVQLRERYCPDFSPPISARENEFGFRYPDAVRRYFDSWCKNCSPRPSSRYRLAIDLIQNRSFRPNVAQLRNELSRRYHELLMSPDATPEEQLNLLLEEFNSRDHPDPPTAESNIVNQKVADTLKKLIPHLPQHLWGTAHRLSACAVWNQNRRDEAEAIYRFAWEIDRKMGQISQELATLTTWQRVHGAMHP